MTVFESIQKRLNGLAVGELYISSAEIELIQTELDERMFEIAKITEFPSADTHLLELGNTQTILATLCYRHRVILSGRLHRFVSEYDRWDDVGVRRHVFSLIKSGYFTNNAL